MRRISRLVTASLAACCLWPLAGHAAGLNYDCQARITRVETIPPAAAGDSSPWQCSTASGQVSTATHWQRNSLEYCRLTVSVYAQALTAALRIAKTHKRHQWIVLMDADETVLDNSLQDRESDRCGYAHSDARWESWVHAGMARDVPGAAAFTNAVHKLGGLVGIVTNRAVADDAVTQTNLKAAGIWLDYETGMTDTSVKTARWQGAETALAVKFGGHPKAVMWLGDQVTDLAVTDAKGRMLRPMNQKDEGDGIGVDRFVIPNPMYGNWMGNRAN